MGTAPDLRDAIRIRVDGLVGFVFYSLPGITNVDGIKSDGLGNLYVAAIYDALVYSIPSHEITQTVVVKGADGIVIVAGT